MQKYLDDKYDYLYLSLAIGVSHQSKAKTKVGAAIVTSSGMISIGWNGTPSGFDNACEDGNNKTLSTVIHAEHNALKKLLVGGISTKGAKIYVSMAPCASCSVQLLDLGISDVIFLEDYKNTDGLQILHEGGINVYQVSEVDHVNRTCRSRRFGEDHSS